MPPVPHWAIALHGGAGTVPHTITTLPYDHALRQSLQVAYEALQRPSLRVPEGRAVPNALAAALAAVETLENCPLFNAGKGAVLNARGFVENEASVMDGLSMRSGAVCGLRTVQNPSRLATLVFAVSDFQFLGFSAAETFADRYPSFIARADPGWFVTDRRRCSLARARATHAERGGGGVGQEGEEEDGGKVEERKSEREGETVGATVCDGFGNVACVTSTGGVTNKWEGRIGDSAIIGAGSYACNAVGAVSGTGWGEEFLRFSAASRVCFAVEMSNVSMRDAVYEVVHNVFRKDTGGFVAVSNDGEAVMDFNSDAMFRASRNWRGEECVKIWH